jgi:endoglucanase
VRHPSRRPAPRAWRALLGLAVPTALVAATAVAGPSSTVAPGPSTAATRLTSASTDNPLAGRPWGVYKGDLEQYWTPYVRSTGTTHELLSKIALRPKAKWFGSWVSPADIDDKVRDYIKNAQAGDPEALVQMADFALKPWEHDACNRLPTDSEVSFYKRWTDSVAGAIGSAHVAMILQPDGPFALCAPGGSQVLSHLIAYAAAEFGSLPNTAVYIDAGAGDWLRDDPAKAADILVPAGVAGVRGFALNSTHYSSTAREVRFGTKIVRELASLGIPGKHFVINTSSNGKPFAGYTYTGPNFDNARVCASLIDTECVTLGIPPTLDVANPAWGLTDRNNRRAKRHVDAYLWFGRPWLYNQADPFDMQRALAITSTTPY